MAHTYTVVELVGTSPDGVTAAIQNGIARAAETLQHLAWFEVVSIRGQVEAGGVQWYQVDLKVGFRMLAPEER